MESVKEVKRKCKGKESRFANRHGFELKFRCLKLRLEEGLPVSLLREEMVEAVKCDFKTLGI